MFEIEDCDMSGDYELLQEIIYKNELTVKWLAFKINMSASHVYRFMQGGCTIPSIVWRVLYAETRDLRIIELFVGDAPVIICDKPQVSDVGLDAVRQMANIASSNADCMVTAAKIMSDGRVDEKDRDLIPELNNYTNGAVRAILHMNYVIQAEYKRSLKDHIDALQNDRPF